MNLSELNIDSFLRLGYFLETPYNKHADFLCHYKQSDSLLDLSESELLKLLKDKFMNIINEGYHSSERNIVPLSGGLDSRAILAGLLEVTEANNIQTLTYGSKGTLDFELGNRVARKFGTTHISVPLNFLDYNLNDLIQVSNKVSHQSILFTHPPLNIIEKYYDSSVIWSGYMGDPIAGSHIVEELNKQDAISKFINKNILFTKIKLSYSADEELVNLLDIPTKKEVDQLTWYEHIDIYNRQKKYIAPHVLMGDYNYKTPFIHNDWINIMLNIDNKYRVNQYIYIKFLTHSFPRIFNIGVKNNSGLPFGASSTKVNFYKTKNRAKIILSNYFPRFITNPFLNYINFSMEIRENQSLLKLIKELFDDLKRRDIVWWLDLQNILNKHLSKQEDNSLAIIILCSLEIHLKAMNI